MQELEKGIIKYPGSANPWSEGNSFIFGHSSNYPWAKGDYNDVFALLNELQIWDEIIVFFKQRKYVYVVREKSIVKPGHVSSLGETPHKKQLTLMTCWPLGTTLNRLLVITELKSTTPTVKI
jgi:LPXTG-site transpeptidase (sortase) family protein